MKDLEVGKDFYVPWSVDDDYMFGEILHIRRNKIGSGSVSTPVARYFVTTAKTAAEGFFRHQRLDCFVSNHWLVWRPKSLARDLLAALKMRGIVAEPVWLAWHVVSKHGGAPFGELFDLD